MSGMRPIRNSAKALIIEDGRVLAIRLRDPEGDWYCLPGGGQEPGESLHETLQRECIEEINSQVEIGDLRFVRDYIGKNHEFAGIEGHSAVHQVEFMFRCRLQAGALPRLGNLPDTNQLSVEWLSLDALDSYRLYPLALRPLIVLCARGSSDLPVYLGDIN